MPDVTKSFPSVSLLIPWRTAVSVDGQLVVESLESLCFLLGREKNQVELCLIASISRFSTLEVPSGASQDRLR